MLIDEEILGSQYMAFGTADIPEGSGLPWNQHEGTEEIIYVLKGSGSAESRTERQAIQPGTVLYMEPHSEHRILNEGKGEMKLLCSFSPPIKIRPTK
ncbi:MAG: cupin domain-containing protein [Deltaproteobacteria bacterium]|nr:cupin domain-containing protein [Deltaproteobacteria bacterium]